tara:strand:- start:18760 stop:19212 length:453 start_codon:yes stop_codon:yes gene_type:complete
MKILSLEEFIVLEKMLNGTDEDMEVAFSNIKNFKLDVTYHMLFIKTLFYKRRAVYMKKFPEYNKLMKEFSLLHDTGHNIPRPWNYRHGSYTWEDILSITKFLFKRKNEEFKSSIMDIIVYQMNKITPEKQAIERYFSKFKSIYNHEYNNK